MWVLRQIFLTAFSIGPAVVSASTARIRNANAPGMMNLLNEKASKITGRFIRYINTVNTSMCADVQQKAFNLKVLRWGMMIDQPVMVRNGVMVSERRRKKNAM